MTSPVPGAYVVKHVSCTWGGADYASQHTKVRLVPNTPIQTLRTLIPNGVVQDIDDPDWTLEIAGAQDWTSAQGLVRYLNDHRGEDVEVVFTPRSGGVTATLTVVAMAAEFGGEKGNWALFELTLPVQGQPEFTDPA
jgi:hypothetical protein